MSTNFGLVEEWAQLNSKLATHWEKSYDLVQRRDEIEKEITWLKGKGASPFPPKKEEKEKKGETVILEENDPKKQRRKSNSEKKFSNLPVLQNVPAPPPSTLSFDVSQNFNKN